MWKTPLEIYVAWEPESALGKDFARGLFSWFTGNPDDPLSQGPGIPVSYRSLAIDAAGQRLAIDWLRSRYGVLIVLVDDAMVSRKEHWRDWLEQALADTESAGNERRLLVCGLSRNFTNLSRKLAAAQAIRLDDLVADPAALGLELAARLSNEICRMLDPKRRDEQSTCVFISHAKRDGRDAALSLKQYVDNAPVGEVFFDEINLQPSKAFDAKFQERIAAATLVILMTDSWASRYWCQWEAMQGKELERPILLVDMLSQGEQRHFPYLGNIPTLRCDPDHLDDAVWRRVIGAAQLETLRDLHEHMRMEALQLAGRLPDRSLYLTRAPELATLVTLLSADDKKGEDLDSVQPLFVYPDPPIAAHEQRLIQRFNPSLKLATPIELLSGPDSNASALAGLVIALTISDSADLEKLGYEQAHVDRLWVALTRHLLALGAGVAYGGDLRGGGYTDILFDLVRAYADEGRLLDERLVHWYLAWPITLKLSEEEKAEMSDVIELRTIEKPADVECPEDTFVAPDDNQYAWLRSLTEMRREMVVNTHARVLIGGQRRASTPRSGIVEEFSMSLRAQQPIYLCGAFGGMTADLIELLKGNDVPASLTDAFQNDTPERALATKEYNASEAGQNDPIDYASLVKEIKTAGKEGLQNGLTPEDNDQLFNSRSVEEIVGLIKQGLKNVARGQSG